MDISSVRRWWRCVARAHRIGRDDADRLLDRAPTRDAHRGVADLLADAAAPARPAELAGEREAVAAFRREYAAGRREQMAGHGLPVPDHLGPAAGRGGTPGRKRSPRRTAIVTISAVAFLLGGTAYAAATGRLPGPVQDAVHDVFSGVGVPPPPTTGPSPSGPVTGAVPSVTSTAPASPATPPAATPDANLTGLCRSWEATRTNPNARALDADELRRLAEAAGGEARIAQFCASLPPGRPHSTGTPGKPGNPDPGGGRPTAPPGGGKGHTK
jgi:hypothetical protein